MPSNQQPQQDWLDDVLNEFYDNDDGTLANRALALSAAKAAINARFEAGLGEDLEVRPEPSMLLKSLGAERHPIDQFNAGGNDRAAKARKAWYSPKQKSGSGS